MPRNLFEDNIQDVFSIQDLDQLKEEGLMNVLAKTDDYLMFEAGKDFWRMDFNTGELVQYNDYVSLRDGINGQVVYSELNPDNNKDYGAVLYDTILATKIEDLPDFTLKEREDYFEDTTKGILKYNVGKEFEKSLEKNKKNSKEIAQKALEPLNKPETKMFVDMVDVVLETLALFYTVYNNKNKQHKKEELIKDILKKLDNRELDIKDVLRNRGLMQEVPELKQILEEWQKNIQKMEVKTSISADGLFNDLEGKNKENLNLKKLELVFKPSTEGEKGLLALPVHTPMNREEVANHLIDNPKINEIAITLSEMEKFHLFRAEQFCKGMDEKLEEEFGENFAENIKIAFERSGEDDPTNFFAKIMVDEKFIEEIKEEFPNISAKDSGLSLAYMNTIIDGGDKKQVSEKLLEKMGKEGLEKPDMKGVLGMIKKMTEKIQKELSQKQTKGMSIR